jgi:hypothetical protein
MTDPTNGARPLSAFGADRIERESAAEIVLVCPISKGWNGRTARTAVRSAHPGMAVAWNESVFEVRAAEPLADGGMRYRLTPWEEGQAIRRFERYDAEAEKARETARQDLASGIRKRRWSIALALLAGHLPGSVQKRMEHEFGAPAAAMTIWSALPPFVVGFLGLFYYLLTLIGGGHGIPVATKLDWLPWLRPPLSVALYLLGESSLRLANALAQGEPMGSLPGVVAYAVWNEARGRYRKRSAGAETSGNSWR